MNNELNDSLFELYEQGGLELYLEGTRGLKRDLIIDPEEGELLDQRAITRNRGVTSWDEKDEFDA